MSKGKRTSQLKKVSNGNNPIKQAAIIKQQQEGIEKQMQELTKLHEQKSKLPDRPRNIYVKADTLEELEKLVEDKIDEGFMLPFGFKQLSCISTTLGWIYVQQMMKR